MGNYVTLNSVQRSLHAICWICPTSLCCVVTANCVRRNVDLFFIRAVTCDEDNFVWAASNGVAITVGSATAIICSIVAVVSIVSCTAKLLRYRVKNIIPYYTSGQKLRWSNVGEVDFIVQV